MEVSGYRRDIFDLMLNPCRLRIQLNRVWSKVYDVMERLRSLSTNPLESRAVRNVKSPCGLTTALNAERNVRNVMVSLYRLGAEKSDLCGVQHMLVSVCSLVLEPGIWTQEPVMGPQRLIMLVKSHL